MHTKFLSRSLKGGDHFEDLDIGGRIILNWILEKFGRNVWTRFMWLRIRTSGGLLRIW
jgi:hypothetical protein